MEYEDIRYRTFLDGCGMQEVEPRGTRLGLLGYMIYTSVLSSFPNDEGLTQQYNKQ